MEHFSIGVDFGTQSARAVLVSNQDGRCISSCSCPYPHGILERMPDGTPLPKDYALQDPDDCLFALKEIIGTVMRQSGVPKEAVTGIGVDATSCSLLPIDENGRPLTGQEKFRNDPESYLRLWKHHAAQKEADEIYEALKAEAPELLPYYGDHISSEWAVPQAS